MIKFLFFNGLFLISCLFFSLLILYINFKKEQLSGKFEGSFEVYKAKKRWTLLPNEGGKPTLFSRYDIGIHGSVLLVIYILLGFGIVSRFY